MKHFSYGYSIFILIFILNGCTTKKPISNDLEHKSHEIVLNREKEEHEFLEACKYFYSSNEEPDYLKTEEALQNFIESSPSSSWTDLSWEILALIEILKEVKNKNLELIEKEKILLIKLNNLEKEKNKLKKDNSKLLNINQKLRENIKLLQDIDIEIERKNK
jgi:hypothetical protein